MAEFANTQEGRQAILSAARYAGLPLPVRPRLAPWLLAVDLGDAPQLRLAESSHTLTHPLLIEVFRRIETLLDGRILLTRSCRPSRPTSCRLPSYSSSSYFREKDCSSRGSGKRPWTKWRRALEQASTVPWSFRAGCVRAQSMLAKSHVGLAGSPGDLREEISAELGSIGVGRLTDLHQPSTWVTQAKGEPSSLDLIVACEESPASEFFDAVNRACLASGTRWLRVSISGTLGAARSNGSAAPDCLLHVP